MLISSMLFNKSSCIGYNLHTRPFEQNEIDRLYLYA